MQPRLRSLLAVALVAALPARALVPGDLMFTSFNADDDSWSLVALAELPPDTTVYFSDNAWDSAAGLFVGSESHHRWNSGPQPITAGTVVRFSHTDSARLLAASAGTLSRARVAGSSTYDLSQSGETLYVYQGKSASEAAVFITALSTGGFAPGTGSLAGTGLTAGQTATQLALGSDFAQYTGSRLGLTAALLQAQTAAATNWADAGDGSFVGQAVSLSAFQVTAVPETGAPLLGLTGLGVLAAWRWRARRRQPAAARPRAAAGTRVGARAAAASGFALVAAGALLGAPSHVHAAEKVTQVVNLGSLVAPVTLNFGDSFNDLDPLATGLQLLREGAALSLQAGDVFVNQYRFESGAVDATVIAGSLDLAGVLNLDALQLQLYAGTALPISTLGGPSALAGLTPLFTGAGTGELQTLDGLKLPAGSYVLEVRGQVAGIAGGSYAGVMNLSPVPEAGGWALAAAGLFVLLLNRNPRMGLRPNGSSAAAAAQPVS